VDRSIGGRSSKRVMDRATEIEHMPHCRGRDATRSTGDATNSPGHVPITVSWCGVMRYSRPACSTVSCYTTVVSSSMPVVADCLFVPDGSGRCMCRIQLFELLMRRDSRLQSPFLFVFSTRGLSCTTSWSQPARNPAGRHCCCLAGCAAMHVHPAVRARRSAMPAGADDGSHSRATVSGPNARGRRMIGLERDREVRTRAIRSGRHACVRARARGERRGRSAPTTSACPCPGAQTCTPGKQAGISYVLSPARLSAPKDPAVVELSPARPAGEGNVPKARVSKRPRPMNSLLYRTM
jgi:hypothetical protein